MTRRFALAAALTLAAVSLAGCHNGNPILAGGPACGGENGLAGPFQHWETVRDTPDLHAQLWDQDHLVFQADGTNACPGSTLTIGWFYFQRIR
jgi:hypothetical protein